MTCNGVALYWPHERRPRVFPLSSSYVSYHSPCPPANKKTENTMGIIWEKGRSLKGEIVEMIEKIIERNDYIQWEYIFPENDTIRFRVTLEDEVPDGQQPNIVGVDAYVIVLDENDNPPHFLGVPYEAVAAEDMSVGTTVLPGIRVVDPDLLGDNIELTCVPQPQELRCDALLAKAPRASVSLAEPTCSMEILYPD
ncbi:hypothetical protein HZH68_014839 [Vespula germanica]|uniref:Cadherin domain-containing protein n=1 Tax=Vespula germanica TaxID=30212 RepID=A0A834J9S8_VESGE|nr:hypothetical protein HZH68_014839 [Vespula germanica]